MNNKNFEKLLEERIALTKSVLSSKNEEYASDTDKLHNFKRAGDMLRCTPEKALIGMCTKHIISILDIVDEIERNNKKHFGLHVIVGLNKRKYKKLIKEKIGDAINYMILLEALIIERYDL